MVDTVLLEERLSIRQVGDEFRVTARESSDLEFKRDFTLQVVRKSLKTVAAFSNCRGGWIVFGVSDRPRNLVGVRKQDIDDGEISEQIVQAISPVPDWSICRFEIMGRKVVALEVQPLERPPVVALRDLSSRDGGEPLLRQGVIYTRRRGQTSPITGAEFTHLLRSRDEQIQSQIFQFLSRGRSIGFDRAIVAGQPEGEKLNDQKMSFYVPAAAARDLQIIDRARLVDEAGAPAYELAGQVQLFSPGDVDPRAPLRAGESVKIMCEKIREIFGEQFPWAQSHIRKAAAHLGFWRRPEGDNVHTGIEPITGTVLYFQAGRETIIEFARMNKDEFVDVVASRSTRLWWREHGKK